MCGIAGIVEFRAPLPEPELIGKMTGAMSHRGPDAKGFYAEGPVALGHLRLAIIDLSPESNQPFIDHSGRYVLVFNGEIYNFREVRARLHDYPFRTNGDTELLVAAYATWGLDCLDHFRGMFAFAIWDRQQRELVLARDRMGVKPLYYYRDNHRILFASELRGILATGLVPPKVSRESLVEFFSYQSVSYPYAMVEGIRQVEAAHWVRIKEGREHVGAYWDLTQPAKDFDLSSREAVHGNIRRLMLQSIERRLVSDVPVGAFLSGGIDSSAVVGLMAEAGTGRPNTFTVAFEEKEYDESDYAGIIAKKFSTHHTRVALKSTIFLDELQNALDALDSPSGDGVNTYVVSKAIRQHGITVALSGAGGDELFAGYPFFDQFLRLQDKKGYWKLPLGLRRLLAGALGRGGGKMGKVSQMLQLPSVDIDRLYPVFREVLSPRLLCALTHLEPSPGFVTAVEKELREKKENLLRLPLLSQVSAAEYLGYTQHTLLKDTDQMSMAVSLEVREPFFDQDLVEFVLAVPDHFKKPAYPKSLLVESLKPLLPDEIVHRKKQGFLFPWELWLKTDLRAFGEQHLRNIVQRPFIKGGHLLEYWKRFQAGDKRVRWQELWLFIVLDHWLGKNKISC